MRALAEPVAKVWLGRVACEELVARVPLAASEQEQPLAPLRQAEGAGIDRAIGPAAAEGFEAADDVAEIGAALEMAPVGHVLPQHVRKTSSGHEVEHVADEAGMRPGQALGPAGLAQIGAGESRR